MNRQEYMRELKEKLRRLPKSDYERAIAYYEEYFDEAGSENEMQAIEDLGSPDEAASQIICDIAVNNTKQPRAGVKKGMKALWVGILAVFAAPIALPILLVILAICMVLLVLIAVLLLCFLVVGAVVMISGPISLIAGLGILTKDFAAAICCAGYGFIGIGIGFLILYVFFHLCKMTMNNLIRFFGRVARKGSKSNEDFIKEENSYE